LDLIGYKHDCEFCDLYFNFNEYQKLIIYILSFYLIAVFGVRSGYDFIYFQF